MTAEGRRSIHRKAPTRRRWLVVIPIVAGLALALSLAPNAASASQGSVNIQQNLDLLADHVSYTMPPTNLAIYYIDRGVLPGGTTGFDPAPTVTMDVVAKISGSSGSGAGWNVKLVDGSTNLSGNLFFGTSDSAYTLKSISVPWPSVDRSLSELDLQPATSTSGTIDIQKAYLNIQQSGIVKATIGRVPMGTHQPQVTSVSYTDIAEANPR